MHGQQMQRLSICLCVVRIKKHKGKYPRQSNLSFALYGQRWIYAMELWADLALGLIILKPQKRLHSQHGFHALSLMKQAV